MWGREKEIKEKEERNKSEGGRERRRDKEGERKEAEDRERERGKGREGSEERDRGTEGEREIKISGDNSVLLVLLHPGLLWGGGLRVVHLKVPSLHSPSSRYPWRCIPITWGDLCLISDMCMSSCQPGNSWLDMLTRKFLPNLISAKAGINIFLSQIPPSCAFLKLSLCELILHHVPSVALTVLETVTVPFKVLQNFCNYLLFPCFLLTADSVNPYLLTWLLMTGIVWQVHLQQVILEAPKLDLIQLNSSCLYLFPVFLSFRVEGFICFVLGFFCVFFVLFCFGFVLDWGFLREYE